MYLVWYKENKKSGNQKVYRLMKKCLVRYLPTLTLESHPKWPFLWLLGDMAWKVFHDSDFYSWISLLEPYSHLRSESSKCKKYSERSHKETKSNCKNVSSRKVVERKSLKLCTLIFTLTYFKSLGFCWNALRFNAISPLSTHLDPRSTVALTRLWLDKVVNFPGVMWTHSLKKTLQMGTKVCNYKVVTLSIKNPI